MSGQSFTLYTYSEANVPEPRWHEDEIGSIFFDSEESAMQAVIGLRDDLARDPEIGWREVQIEKIQTVPVTKETILTLLNDGIGTFIQSYEIVGIVSKNEPSAE